MFMLNINKTSTIVIFRLRSPLTLDVATLTQDEWKCDIYFLACFRKIAGKQSHVLWIHDIQRCTMTWWFETKEHYYEDNKQHETKFCNYHSFINNHYIYLGRTIELIVTTDKVMSCNKKLNELCTCTCTSEWKSYQ